MLIGMLPALTGAASQGVLWGIMVLGVYITYKILNIADLTVDGSFALGGAVCAVLITSYHMNPVLALCIAALSGIIAGAVTGILHTVFDIPNILAGILTQISLWSINLGIMGKSNIPLLKANTIFSVLTDSLGIKSGMGGLLIGVLLSIISILVLYWFFGTEIGSVLRATGNNEAMIRALGVNTKLSKLLGLMISNALVAFSGALICQNQKYADINMGTGAIVIGLAAIVIGEVLISKKASFIFKFSSCIIGSIIYFIIRAFVLYLGLDPNYMKLLSAILVFVALAFPVLLNKFQIYKAYTKEGVEGEE